MIDLIIKTNGSERHLSLPIDEQFVPGITEKNSVTTVMVVNEPESLRYLVGKQWSVDELNFLAKRLESFDKLEDAQFNAAVSYLQPQSIKDLINLTFNLPRYSIIRNVFNLAEVGRTYIITRQQAMSLEEIEQTDFAKIGREVLTSGKGIPTEYGLLFINEDIPEEQVYDGKHFPEYAYKDSLLCVSVSCKGETEYDIIGFSSNQGLGEACALTWAAGNGSEAGYGQIGWQFYKIIGGKSITCNLTYQKHEPTKFTINHYTIDKSGSKTLYSSSTTSYTYGNSMYIGRVYPTGYSLEDGYLSSISGTFTYDVLKAGKNVDTRLYYNYHKGSKSGEMYDWKSYTKSSKDYISYCDNREIKVTFLYRINSYTISFDANGGSGAPEAVTKYYGDTLTLPSTTPTRSGYTFQGWGTSASSTSASYQPGGSYTSNSAITLYAVWKSNAPTTYTVSYNANGGSGAPSSQTKTKDVTLTLSSTRPTRSGYTFKGWSTSSTATSATYQPGGSYTSNAAVTLYAVWQKNATTYSVTYNANGGSGAPGTQTKTENVALTLSSTKPTRSGYTFKGWATSSTATVASYQPGSSYTANAKVTLYAVWSKNPSQYTVSYNANGGSGAPPSQTKTEGVALTLSATKPTRSGYTFLGWSTSSTAISATYSAGGSYTANAGATLYAVWSCNHTTTSRVYVTGCDWEQRCDQCGAVTSTGTTHGPYSYGDWTYYSSSQHKRVKSCDYGDYSTNEYASHNTEKRYSHYNSSQHAVNQYCTDCKTNIGSTTYESHNFVATVGTASTVYRCSQCQYSYEVANTYTVMYNANGGTGAPGAQVKTHGENLTLSSVKPSKSNCVFLGWNTQSTATVSQYSAGSTYFEV